MLGVNMREIPLSVPNLDPNNNGDVVENLKKCIDTGWVSTGGEYIAAFEEALASYIGANGAAGCQSGTAGLHVALRVLGVNAGDEVIVPTLTFIAAVNPVIYQGAIPVFMDCDENFCLDPDKLERFFKDECVFTKGVLRNKTSGARISAIVAVHIFGNMADMDKIMELAGKYDIKVIEDATESLGCIIEDGVYSGKHAGTVGDMGVFSFNANKIITTGGGGMITAKNKDLLEKARYLSTTAKDDALFFVHDEVGYNYRMLNIQAALGVSQMKLLEDFIEIKRRNFDLYKSCISEMEIQGLIPIPYSRNVRSNNWFYSFDVDEERFGMSRDALMHSLIEIGIQSRPVWRLCHRQQPYEKAQAYKIEQALRYERTIINLPCSTNLKEEDVIYVCENIKKLQSSNNL
jgi:aminotransferase in exopolysaccharide biosynthesis